MPRAPGPKRMQRDLDRTILAQLKAGKIRRLVGDKVIETDLPAAFLEMVRKRIKDLGADRTDPKDTAYAALKKLADAADDPSDPDRDAEEKAERGQVEAKYAAKPKPPQKPQQQTPAELAAQNERLRREIAALKEGEGAGDGW